jgi:hypothetical protein
MGPIDMKLAHHPVTSYSSNVFGIQYQFCTRSRILIGLIQKSGEEGPVVPYLKKRTKQLYLGQQVLHGSSKGSQYSIIHHSRGQSERVQHIGWGKAQLSP